MSERIIAKRYAKALLSLAESRGAADAAQEELAEVCAWFQAEPEALTRLADPSAPPAPRVKAVEALAEQAGLSDLMRHFLRRLIEAQRINLLLEIGEEFRAQVQKRLGQVEVVVAAARPVPPAQQQALQRVLEQKTGKHVTIQFEHDPALGAGARVRIGNVVIDGSAAGRLRLLAQRLAQGRVHEHQA